MLLSWSNTWICWSTDCPFDYFGKHADTFVHTNQRGFFPGGVLLFVVLKWPNPHLASVYNLLSKPIYFHPPGMKASLKPAELSQHPEQPLNFTHSQLLRSLQRLRPTLITVLIYFKQCIWGRMVRNPSPPPLTLALLFSSFIPCHSQQRAAPLPSSKAGAGCKLLLSA